MPITGKFEADFSQFSSATKGANEDLKSLGTTATTTTAQITSLEKATTTAGPRASSLAESYHKFDGALNAVGIHIGPQIKAIEDIGNAAGKSASEIGLLGSAGLVAGAALAGWNFGRWIAGITGADQAIVTFADHLFNTGLRAQEAGAVQDSIALAFQRTKIHATSAAQALQLNTQWAKEHQAAAKADAKAHNDWAAAMVEVNSAGKGWQGTLETIDGETVEAVKYYLAAGVSQGALAKAYELTDTQVKAVAASLAAATAASRAAAEAAEKDAKAIAAHWADVGKVVDQVLGKDALETATNWTDAIGALGGSLDKLSNEQLVELQAAMRGGIEALGKMGQLTSAQSSQFAALMAAAAAAIPPIKELTAASEDYTAEANAIAKANDELIASMLKVQSTATTGKTAQQTATDRANQSFGGGTLGAVTSANTSPEILSWMSKGYTLGEAIAIAMGQGAQIIGRSPTQLNAISGGNFRAAGGPVTAGGAYVVGERGPELFTPGVSGTISPTAPGAGGVAVAMTVNYPIMNDPAALDQLARLVGQAVMARVTRPGTLV
jgi:hypothetical protein